MMFIVQAMEGSMYRNGNINFILYVCSTIYIVLNNFKTTRVSGFNCLQLQQQQLSFEQKQCTMPVCDVCIII